MPDQTQEQSWIEFSLLVEQDQADQISEILAGLVPGGLVAEKTYQGIFPHELDAVVVPVRIYGYLPNDPHLAEAQAQIRAALALLAPDLNLPDPVYAPLLNQNWATVWQERYQPIPLGRRIMIVPSWLENPQPERLEIKMDPGMAFGSGTHPTTQLGLILLEECLDAGPVKRMIDVGCGSGILAIAAGQMGAEHVLGVDNDPEAVLVAAANALLNQVSSKASFASGSVADIVRGDFDLDQAELVAANIIAPILKSLFEEGLAEIVSPGGTLLLSGILEEQLPDMLEILERTGLKLRKRIQEGEWVAIWAENPTG